MRLRRLAAAALAVLAGCSASPPRFPAFAVSGTPISLQVMQVTIEDAVPPATDSNDVAAQSPQPPDRALLAWAQTRLRAAAPASRLTARFTVSEARILAAQPPDGTAPAGALLLARYDGSVAGRLDILDASGRVLASTTLGGAASRDASRSLTPEDRRRLFYALTQDVIMSLDSDAADRIAAQLAAYAS